MRITHFLVVLFLTRRKNPLAYIPSPDHLDVALKRETAAFFPFYMRRFNNLS